MQINYPFPFRDTHPEMAEKFNNYVKEHQYFLSNMLVKSFLENEVHLRLLARAICFPSQLHDDELDRVFRQFYFDARFTVYITTLIQRNSRDYDRKQRMLKDRYLLILDQSINENEEESVSYIDKFPAEGDVFQQVVDRCLHFRELIEDSEIYRAFNQLTNHQKRILELAYIEEMKDKRIAKLLGVSQQSISMTRKRALERMRKSILKGGKVSGSI